MEEKDSEVESGGRNKLRLERESNYGLVCGQEYRNEKSNVTQKLGKRNEEIEGIEQ